MQYANGWVFDSRLHQTSQGMASITEMPVLLECKTGKNIIIRNQQSMPRIVAPYQNCLFVCNEGLSITLPNCPVDTSTDEYSGAYPVHANMFKVKVNNRYIAVKGLETFDVSFDSNIEEWNQHDNEGWVSSARTGMKWSITFSGKRIIGDTGNDFLASSIMKNILAEIQWIFPDGSALNQRMIVTTEECGGETVGVDIIKIKMTSTEVPAFLPSTKRGD